jgi:hypothetical protein
MRADRLLIRNHVALLVLTFTFFSQANAAEQPKATLAKKNVAYANFPFNSDVARFPKEFLGVDPNSLFQALQNNPEPIKREFETSEQFTARHKIWSSRPVVGSITPTSLIAFTFRPDSLPTDQASFRYNADTSEMTFSLFKERCGHSGSLIVAAGVKNVGSYVGQNAFGVKMLIRKTAVTRFCLSGISTISVTFPMPREKAVADKYLARFALIGKLASPYNEILGDYSAPKIDSPSEIRWTDYVLNFTVQDLWIFSGDTGDILYKSPRGSPVDVGKSYSSDDTASDKQLDENGNTGLHLAIWYGETTQALRIIEIKSVDLNSANKFGATALHLAVAKNNVRVARALIGAGASIDVRDNAGATPLLDALNTGNRDILDLFEPAGAK